LIEKSEYSFIGKLYQSILQVSIYKSMVCANQELVSVKPNLDICATEELDIRVNHRIRFSIITDLTLLNPDALSRLKKFPLALVKIVQSINESLRNNPGFDDLGKKKYIDKDDIYRYILKPNIDGLRINPDFSCVMIKKQQRDDVFILSLLQKLIDSIKFVILIINKNKLTKYIYVVEKVLFETQVVYSNLKNSNYTDLLLFCLTQKSKIEEIESNILHDNETDNFCRYLMTVYNNILNIISELRIENDGTYDPSSNCSSNISRQTVLSTSVIARDGIRGANISDYIK